MATITIRHIHRRQGRNEKELTTVVGEIVTVGRSNAIPAGSFGGLRQVPRFAASNSPVRVR